MLTIVSLGFMLSPSPSPRIYLLAFLPIIAASFWWKYYSLAVAVFLSFFSLGADWGGQTTVPWLEWLLPPFSFLSIALVISSLTTRIDNLNEEVILAEENCLKTRKAAEMEKELLSAAAKEHEDQLIHSSRLAELGEMAAAMAHELNQPLTGIKNYARNAIYMLEEKEGTEEDIRDNLQQISRQVDRSTKIINQLRELARKTEYDFTLVNINEVVKESLEFLDPHLKLSGVAVECELAEYLPPVRGDKVRLEQVFLNILTNARQALEGCGERLLRISTFFEDKESFLVNVIIRDTGCGFKQQNADKLFAPFYTTKNPGQGTGLGLSISLSIIKSHQGSIEATGEVGRGACFTIKIPRAQ